jgi:hypothetical protein
MALKITDQKITSDRTEHWAEFRGWWSVSWAPGRQFAREQAVTAMMLTEALRVGVTKDSPQWQQCADWAAELGFSLSEAWHLISLPLDPEHKELTFRRSAPQREADFEAGG